MFPSALRNRSRKEQAKSARCAIDLKKPAGRARAECHRQRGESCSLLKEADEVLPDSLEEVRFSSAEKGEGQRRVADEGAKHPSHLRTNQRKEDDPPAKYRTHVCAGRWHFRAVECPGSGSGRDRRGNFDCSGERQGRF